MARNFSPEQLAEIAAFVHQLLDLGDWKKDVDLAKAARVPASNFSVWKNANGGLDGYSLLSLIRATAERVGQSEASLAILAQSTADRLRSVEGRVEVLRGEIDGVVHQAELFDRQIGSLERLGDGLDQRVSRLEHGNSGQKAPRSGR